MNVLSDIYAISRIFTTTKYIRFILEVTQPVIEFLIPSNSRNTMNSRFGVAQSTLYVCLDSYRYKYNAIKCKI